MEAVVLVAMVVLVPVAIHFGRKQKRRRLQVYREVADRYPESDITVGGSWRRHELHVTHNDARITVWMWATKNSRGTVWQAQLSTPLPRFRVYKEGVGSALGKSMFKTQDIEVGAHRAFDDHFMVKGDDPPLIRRAWSRSICELMTRRFSRSRIVSDDRELKLVENRLLDSPSDIADGIELLGGLSACDIYGVGALHSLEGATVHAGAPPYAIVHGPTSVQIGPVAMPTGTVTRASCAGGGSAGDAPPMERLEAVGASFTREGKQLHLTWPGIETSVERLAAAVELLHELARGPSENVYR